MKKQGRALLSVREGDKERVVDLAAKLLIQGFELDATHGTAIVLGEAGINPRLVNKVHEGRPHIQDRIKNGEYTYIINTTAGRQAIEDKLPGTVRLPGILPLFRTFWFSIRIQSVSLKWLGR